MKTQTLAASLVLDAVLAVARARAHADLSTYSKKRLERAHDALTEIQEVGLVSVDDPDRDVCEVYAVVNIGDAA